VQRVPQTSQIASLFTRCRRPSSNDGLVRFRNFRTVADELKEMAAFESESMFGDTTTQATQATETLGAYLDNTTQTGASRPAV
jgi:hypothetical protein